MKVAVIGAGGFVGQALARRLASTPAVGRITLLDRVAFAHPADPRVTVLTGDFADPATRARAVEGADAVIHLAAILGGAAEADPRLARRVNLDATLDLMEDLSARSRRTRFVFASTIAVFAKPLPDPVTDETPTGPTMVYGAHKLMVEVAVANYAAKGWLDAVALRPSGVMARDGGDAGLKSAFLSRLFHAIRRGEDITIPLAPDSRTWLSSVSTVAENLLQAALIPDLGPRRALTLPALSLTMADLVAALHRRFPASPARVTFAPEPEMVALFGSYPALVTDAALRLGLVRDADADALVANALPDPSLP